MNYCLMAISDCLVRSSDRISGCLMGISDVCCDSCANSMCKLLERKQHCKTKHCTCQCLTRPTFAYSHSRICKGCFVYIAVKHIHRQHSCRSCMMSQTAEMEAAMSSLVHSEGSSARRALTYPTTVSAWNMANLSSITLAFTCTSTTLQVSCQVHVHTSKGITWDVVILT